MIVDNDVNILFTSMVPGSYTETRWKKRSFTHGGSPNFSKMKGTMFRYWLLIFPPIIFCHFDEVSVLKSNITTYLIRNVEMVSSVYCSYSESRLTAYCHFMLSKDLYCLMFVTEGIFLHSMYLYYKIKCKL